MWFIFYLSFKFYSDQHTRVLDLLYLSHIFIKWRDEKIVIGSDREGWGLTIKPCDIDYCSCVKFFLCKFWRPTFFAGFKEWLCAKHHVDFWGHPHAGWIQHANIWRRAIPRSQSEAEVLIIIPSKIYSFRGDLFYTYSNCTYFSFFFLKWFDLFFRESNKPINILTGIDYWLDNLMCNVPELVMCFHVNGIVQVNFNVSTFNVLNILNDVIFPNHIEVLCLCRDIILIILKIIIFWHFN